MVGADLFKAATPHNTVTVLLQSVKRFGVPASILSDNDSCFVGLRRNKKTSSKKTNEHYDIPKGTWQPTEFENELLDLGIHLINSRPYHPQTNGKLERFHGIIESKIWHYKTLAEYITYYNKERLHYSLDMKSGETPLAAFYKRAATQEIRENDTTWMERDINE